MKKHLLIIFPFLFNYSSGQITFQKAIGGSGNDVCYSVTQIKNGGVVLSGYTYSFGAGG